MTELVPASIKFPDIAAMPLEQRGELITRALMESKSWLTVATVGTDPTPIAEFKAWAATVAEMTKQKGLAKEIQLDALEMVRRAERGIGLAIRNGQDAGGIATREEMRSYAGRASAASRNLHQQDNREPFNQKEEQKTCGFLLPRKPVPSDFATQSELTNSDAGIYHLTDYVSDEEFEEAVTEARGERNLSRANVVRKIRGIADEFARLPVSERIQQLRSFAEQGWSSRQIAPKLGVSPERVRELARNNNIKIHADQVMARTKDSINLTRVVRNTVEGLATSMEVSWSLLGESNLETLPSEEIPRWVESLDNSIQAIQRLRRKLNNVHQSANYPN